MILKNYINAIKEYIGGSQTEVVKKLFFEANAVKEVKTETAKCWLRPIDDPKYRKCKIKDYFPFEKVDEDSFIEFLRSKVNISWPVLQKAFRLINDDGIINVTTNTDMVFYWSLLNQFQKIFELPISNLPAKILSIDETTVGNQALNTSQTNAFENVIKEQESSTSGNKNKKNMPQANSQNTNANARIAIPQDCKKCLYCKNWKGNVHDANESPSGVYGRCIIYNENKRSTESSCDDFRENFGLLEKTILQKRFVFYKSKL